ncbi:hypothetical protein FZC83_02105 [Rossellomorea marisflavi]|uniref:Uncharacterized protein n=1 Tax=Rossellomorea marisflavi TaxID=189381 RepID=A0A5D4S0C7_9BACI|nr:hypothetical protein [Rossellomorea marisflavi]TYS56389.1 hypothetical protein FZC83_02105 [Rossellomorea marisflavi]
MDEYQKAVNLRNKNLPIFFSIVGKSPLDHIDYILKHGIRRFNYYLDCLEEGTLYAPATVEEYKPVTSGFEFRGGLGNKVISFHHTAIQRERRCVEWT